MSMINNPEFKGEWKPKQIDNPDYKGPWVHPMIANPEFVADDALYAYDSWGAIGLDLWQVKSGSVFDNFLISDDIDGALEAAKKVVADSKEGEEAMKAEQDKAEEEAAKAAADEAGEDDEEDDDDEFDDVDEEDDDFEEDEDEFAHEEL